MTAIPPEAERHDAFSCIEYVRLPSRLAPGAEQMKPVLTCPGCQRRSPVPTYFKPFNCDCGLTAQIEGSFLYVWRTSAPVR